jgi:hypothetical protein
VQPPPQPVPSVLALSSQQKSHRGLYMALGAVIMLAGLVVAGIYIPRRARTSANEPGNAAPQANPATASSDSTSSSGSAGSDAAKSPTTDATAASPQNSDSASPPQNPPIPPVPGEAQAPSIPVGMANGPNAGTGAGSKQADQVVPAADLQVQKKHTANKNSKSTTSTLQSNQEADASQNSQTPSAASGQLDELEQQADQLSSQVSSVNESLDNLRRQQSTQGLGLRGDIASAQDLMKTHMTKAQAALQNRDAASAKKYLDLAEQDVAKLDKFLGR